MSAAVGQAIAQKRCPGAVLWLEHRGVAFHKAYGNRALVPGVEPMTEDTIFDAASLTKVVACTPAVMLLVERGRLKLDERVQAYLPEFKGDGKEAITIRQLLTHTSGLRGDIETRTDWHGQAAAIQRACAEQLVGPPGSAFRYSDINFFLLGEVVQRVSGSPLQEFVALEIYRPLQMADTGFLPPDSKRGRIAPTELVNGQPWRGVVHDPTARHMGGVAGHAGLFTTAADLARYARMLLNEGALEGVRIFKPETVRLMTRVQTPETMAVRRGLGWDIDSPYSGPRGAHFPVGSYGHTGWTGTSLWVDPFSQTFVIFLSNRNHPEESGNVNALRARLGTLAAEAIGDFNFAYVPGALAARPGSTASTTPGGRAPRAASGGAAAQAGTLNGIDVLVKQNFRPLQGLRIGLVTNHTGQDRQRNPTIDLLRRAPGVQLKALFSPEHGIRGVMDEPVGDSVDGPTGLPVYSLYGERLGPAPSQLRDLDALVFDIQDVGCRFYTYTTTMAKAMEAAAAGGKKYFVLDRVNPINGVTLDGPVLTGKPGFVGYHMVPLRYGMTIGELARMFNAERKCNADLTVIPLENWRREFWFDQTGLPWMNPSPNMRNLTEAILYPGIGLLESALSVGRGTDTPFEVLGAPYIDDLKLAEELNRAGLPGVRFVPVCFTPTYSVHKGQPCRGVYLLLTDRDQCNVVDVALQIAQTLFRLYPKDFDPDKMRHLLLDPATLDALKANKPLQEIHAAWRKNLEEFSRVREKYLLDLMLKGYTIPRTPRGTSSLVATPPWHYVGDALAVEFEADAGVAAAFLPEGLELHSGRCAVYFVEWQSASEAGDEYLDPIRSQYHETLVLLSARFEGAPVAYCPFIWVDQDVALMRGLVQGWPKQIGSTWITRAYDLPSKAAPVVGPGGRFGAALSVKERRLIEAQVTLREPTQTPPSPGFARAVNTRHFPELAAGKHDLPAVHELVQLKSRDVRIAPIWKGDATLRFFDHPYLELPDLRPMAVGAGYRFSFALTVDDLVPLRDLRRPA